MTGCNSWKGHLWPKWSAVEYHPDKDTPDMVKLVQRRNCMRCNMEQTYTVVNLHAGNKT